MFSAVGHSLVPLRGAYGLLVILIVLFSTTVEFYDDIQVLNGDIASREKRLMEVRPIDV